MLFSLTITVFRIRFIHFGIDTWRNTKVSHNKQLTLLYFILTQQNGVINQFSRARYLKIPSEENCKNGTVK